MRSFCVAMLIAAGCGTAAQAQDSVRWQPAPAVVQGAKRMYFPVGTPVPLITRTEISTKENKPGDCLYFEVAEAVSYQGQVVIPVGSVAVGEVARTQENGHFGKKGKIDIRLLYVQTPWGPVRLEGHRGAEGKSGTVASVATIALVSTLGFLIHGTSAAIPYGTSVNGYLAEPLGFTWSAQQSIAPVAIVRPDGLSALDTIAARAPADK